MISIKFAGMSVSVKPRDNTVTSTPCDFNSTHPVYHSQIEKLAFVILTDHSGANRVYKTNGKSFVLYDGDMTVIDDDGVHWQQNEKALVSDSGEVLKRLPAHRAFWFGWYPANNDTRLIH